MVTELANYIANTYGGGVLSSASVTGGTANADYYSAKWWEAKRDLDAGKLTAAEFSTISNDLHRKAEEIRANVGYSGGTDGSNVLITNENLFQSIVEKVTNRTPGESIGSVDESIFNNTYAGKKLASALGNAISGAGSVVGDVVRTTSDGINAVGTSVSKTTSSGATGFGNLAIMGIVLLLGLSLAGRRK